MFGFAILGAGLGMLLLYLGIGGYFSLLFLKDAIAERRREADRVCEEEEAVFRHEREQEQAEYLNNERFNAMLPLLKELVQKAWDTLDAAGIDPSKQEDRLSPVFVEAMRKIERTCYARPGVHNLVAEYIYNSFNEGYEAPPPPPVVREALPIRL